MRIAKRAEIYIAMKGSDNQHFLSTVFNGWGDQDRCDGGVGTDLKHQNAVHNDHHDMENVLEIEVEQVGEEGRAENCSLDTEKLGIIEDTKVVSLLENIGMKKVEHSKKGKVSLPSFETDTKIVVLGAGAVVDDVDDFGTLDILEKGPVQN